MSNDFKNPYAELGRADSANYITPDEAVILRDGGRKDFYCPDSDCRDPYRRLSLVEQKHKRPFFRHYHGYDHNSNPETLLHKLAVKWFADKTAFEIPSHESEGKALKQQTVQLDAAKTRLEYNIANTIRPDVMLHTESGFTFAVEIVVTSDVHSAKAKKIELFNLPTLRIDFSRFYLYNRERCQTDKQFIESSLNRLLADINLKSWVKPPAWDKLPAEIEVIQITEPANEPATTHTPQNENTGCFVILPLIGAGYLLYTLL
ncbi:MAG: hypothetical protein FD123_2758 [Bacteroidetes bacterium]|nr:MAG: hypothetical protein FD123_2758 [Bacteroidota bacterium]